MFVMGKKMIFRMPGFFGKSVQFKRDLETYWERLYRVSYSLSHDQQLAADLVQATVETALLNCHKIADTESLERWLFRVLVNKWRDHCRTRKFHTAIDDVSLAQQGSPETDIELKETVQRVHLAMSKLTEEHREILSLIAIEGFSYDQVASILELPVGTVMSRLCRSRKQLRKLLANSGTVIDSGLSIRRIK